MNVTNYMIHTAIVEIIAIGFFYFLMVRLLAIDKKNRWMVLLLFILKMGVLNMVMVYFRAQGYDGSRFIYRYGILNTLSLVIIWCSLKIITGHTFFKILFATFLGSIMSTMFIIFPYFLICGVICGRQDTYMDQNVGGVSLLSVAIILFLLILVFRVIDSRMSDFAVRDFRWKPVWWTLIIGEFLYGIHTYIDNKIFNMKWYVPLVAGEIIVFLIVIYEVTFVYRKREEKRIRMENQILQAENSLMKEYCTSQENLMQQTRKFHHDITKHIAVLKELSSEQSKKYTEELEEEYKSLIPIFYCTNPILNAILLNKKKQCYDKKLQMEIQIQELEMGSMKEIDVVALWANLLDNAIEACEKLPENQERRISIVSGKKQDNLFIIVKNNMKNTMIEKTFFNTKLLETSKKDKDVHGVGLQIIKDTVEKYNGSIEAECIQSSFGESAIMEIVIQLPIEE